MKKIALLILVLLFAAVPTAQADYGYGIQAEWQYLGSDNGVDFHDKWLVLSDGSGGKYDEVVMKVTNRAVEERYVFFTPVLWCANGTEEVQQRYGFRMAAGTVQSGEGAGLWWRGCGGSIARFEIRNYSAQHVW